MRASTVGTFRISVCCAVVIKRGTKLPGFQGSTTAVVGTPAISQDEENKTESRLDYNSSLVV